MHPVPINETNYNDLNQESCFNDFENNVKRRSFINKTFLYFFISLISTYSSCTLFQKIEVYNYIKTTEIGQAIGIFSIVGFFFTTLSILCNENILKGKYKYFWYLLFVYCFSFFIGFSTHNVKQEILNSAIIITTGTTGVLTIYSCFTTIDFTRYFDVLLMILIVIIFTGIVNIFFLNSIIYLFITGVSSLLFMFFIIIDIQMIVGSKHIKYKFSTDDYLLASIILYLDVINLFLYIIQCLTFIEN